MSNSKAIGTLESVYLLKLVADPGSPDRHVFLEQLLDHNDYRSAGLDPAHAEGIERQVITGLSEKSEQFLVITDVGPHDSDWEGYLTDKGLEKAARIRRNSGEEAQ